MGTQRAGADAQVDGNGQLSPLDRRAAEWTADRSARRAAAEIARAALIAASAETAAHSDDVDVIAEGLCHELGVSGAERDDIVLAARLHDIGKVSIPGSILEKPDHPDEREWTILRKHTVVGEDIVRAVPELAAVATLVRHSHERWDGDGYPDGLAGKEIPLGSRIIFCADAFHAIRSDRPYRAGRSARAALREIRAGAGSQFDPRVVAALLALTQETQRTAGLGRRLNPRSNRLVALLLVLSTGAAAAALARTGLLGEPDVPTAGASANPPATAAPLPGLPAFAIGGDPAKAAICTGCESGAQGLLARPLSAFGLDVRGKKGEPSAQAGGGPADSVDSHAGAGQGIGSGGKAGSDSGGGSSATAPPVGDPGGGEGNNGVRDHGAGEGRDGHGQGKGQGDTNGNGHEGLADGSPTGGGAGADAGGSGGQPNGHGGPHDAPPPPSADTSISTPLDTTSPSAVGKGHGGGRHGRA